MTDYVIINSSGGVIQDVTCDPDIRVISIDWDDINVHDEWTPEIIEVMLIAFAEVPPTSGCYEHAQLILADLREAEKIENG